MRAAPALEADVALYRGLEVSEGEFLGLKAPGLSLHHEPVTHDEPVKGGNTPGCQPDDIADAQANMPPLPPQRRIPKEKCGV